MRCLRSTTSLLHIRSHLFWEKTCVQFQHFFKKDGCFLVTVFSTALKRKDQKLSFCELTGRSTFLLIFMFVRCHQTLKQNLASSHQRKTQSSSIDTVFVIRTIKGHSLQLQKCCFYNLQVFLCCWRRFGQSRLVRGVLFTGVSWIAPPSILASLPLNYCLDENWKSPSSVSIESLNPWAMTSLFRKKKQKKFSQNSRNPLHQPRFRHMGIFDKEKFCNSKRSYRIPAISISQKSIYVVNRDIFLFERWNKRGKTLRPLEKYCELFDSAKS